ncbi:cation:proton antiporter [Kitasatospora sp. NPDC088779]|uniref:cation:proton antiporter domain-containing protein n=1 Tax=Kitasatospora sp. NPDC088779 TaxID=3154964 RepID=UPI0034269754
MTSADLAIITGLVFVWGMLSARLERLDMTAPIVFTSAGVLLTHGPLTPLGITPSPEMVKVLAEATLALVLFSDASRVGLRQLRPDLGLCLRLLLLGLPLSIGLGTLAAFALPGVGTVWLALLVGSALAPTDAALGAAVMVDPALHRRGRPGGRVGPLRRGDRCPALPAGLADLRRDRGGTGDGGSDLADGAVRSV